MIEYLSDWMRGLILVIFLAVFLDMLLPSNKMQRYVRLVMGLLIILIMLGPILKLYNGDNVYRMNFSLDTLVTDEDRTGMPGTEEVLAQGEKLSQNASDQTVEQWKTAIAEHITRSLESSYPVSVSQVEVKFALDSAGRPLQIAGLHLTLGPKQDPTAMQPIQPVKPVRIGESTEEAQAGSPSAQKADAKTIGAIRKQVAEDYQLNQADVRVDWHES